MRISTFVSDLREKIDYAVSHEVGGSEIVASYCAPSSGFCGPSIRPKFLGHGRYGLTLDQARRIVHALTGVWPARTKEEQDA